MKQWLRPTLKKRVFAALVMAFFLVWSVLVIFQYISFKQEMASNSGLQKVAKDLSLTLEKFSATDQAKVVVAATDDYFNRMRHEAGVLPDGLLFELVTQDGQRIYASPALGMQALTAPDSRVVERSFNGRGFWVVQQDSARWSLRVAEPALTDATILRLISNDLILYLVLAFPFVLLPMWIAISVGLRPLRQLVSLLAARKKDDLSSIQLDLKYAELKPVVTVLEDLLVNLRGKIQRERELVQDAAHELQTPLAVIIAQAELVSRAVDATDREQAQSQLASAISRASHLTQQLLVLNAMDESRRPAMKTIDVAHFIRQEIAQSATTAWSKKIDVSLEAPEALPQFMDVPAFHSILRNLLDNALRYVPEGGHVVVQLLAADGMMSLVIADDGHGIPDTDRMHVFERFYRGRDHGVVGSGLGLAIVKQATMRMHGRVEISSGLNGRGCKFTVDIPLTVGMKTE